MSSVVEDTAGSSLGFAPRQPEYAAYACRWDASKTGLVLVAIRSLTASRERIGEVSPINPGCRLTAVQFFPEDSC